MTKPLIQMLINAGYPKSKIFHHESDLYIFVTPLTSKIIDEWAKTNGYNKSLFVSNFNDNITGKLMYDVAFQYYPYFENKEV